MMFAAQLSVLFIYLLMGFLFESFILPLSIISTIPLAGIGVVWIHYALGYNLDFLGVVGIVLLIGVVVNNGIVLIDYANRLRAEGLERGEALYKEHCVKCHGDYGEGKNAEFQPRIQGQHYEYLLRQFHHIKSGRRKNADETMVKQIKGFSERDIVAVVDYTSRLRPPADLSAPAGWRNPDFPPDFTHVPGDPPTDVAR